MPTWSEYFGFEPAGDDYQIHHHNVGLAIFYGVLIIGAAIAVWRSLL